MENYLNDNKRPTALRSLVDTQLQNEDVRIFASQVLTADNWYQGYDINAAEQYTAKFINDIINGEIVLDDKGQSLGIFVNRIKQTYNKIE